MSTQDSGGVEGLDYLVGPRNYNDRDVEPPVVNHVSVPGPGVDPRVAALAMLSLHAARRTNSQVQADSSTQEGDAGRGGAVGQEDAEDPDKAVDKAVRLPGVRKTPTGEGYCRHCHFIVGTWRRRLIRHAGYWALWTGGAVHKSPKTTDLCTDLVVWCPGSGRLPSPPPENMIDPWEYHVDLEKKS